MKQVNKKVLKVVERVMRKEAVYGIRLLYTSMDNGKELQIAQRRSNDFREEVNKFLQRNS